MERVYRPTLPAVADYSGRSTLAEPTSGGVDLGLSPRPRRHGLTEPTCEAVEQHEAEEAVAGSAGSKASYAAVDHPPITIPTTNSPTRRSESTGTKTYNNSSRGAAQLYSRHDVEPPGNITRSNGQLASASPMHQPYVPLTEVTIPTQSAAIAGPAAAYSQGMRGSVGLGGAMPRSGPHAGGSRPSSSSASIKRAARPSDAATAASQPASNRGGPLNSSADDEVLFNQTMTSTTSASELVEAATLVSLGGGVPADEVGFGGQQRDDEADAGDGMDDDGGGDSDDDGDDDGNDDPTGMLPEELGGGGTGGTAEGGGQNDDSGTTSAAESQEILPRGHLMFHADYEGGNMASVKASADLAEYEVTLRHDSMAPRYRLWFWFTVTNVTPGQRAIISVVNFSKTKSLYRHGMTPIVRSTSRPSWQRLPPKSVFYYRSSKHRNAYVLSFVFVFDEADDEYEFAYTYPYTYTRLQRQLASYDRLALDCCRRELLCRTPQLRRVDVLTICDPPDACLMAAEEPGEGTYGWQRDSAARLASGSFRSPDRMYLSAVFLTRSP